VVWPVRSTYRPCLSIHPFGELAGQAAVASRFAARIRRDKRNEVLGICSTPRRRKLPFLVSLSSAGRARAPESPRLSGSRWWSPGGHPPFADARERPAQTVQGELTHFAFAVVTVDRHGNVVPTRDRVQWSCRVLAVSRLPRAVTP
jgi:hypothetical protein